MLSSGSVYVYNLYQADNLIVYRLSTPMARAPGPLPTPGNSAHVDERINKYKMYTCTVLVYLLWALSQGPQPSGPLTRRHAQVALSTYLFTAWATSCSDSEPFIAMLDGIKIYYSFSTPPLQGRRKPITLSPLGLLTVGMGRSHCKGQILLEFKDSSTRNVSKFK